jgi:hypothetical protein
LAAGQIVSPPVIPPISLRQEKSPWLSVLTMQEA